MTDHKDRKRVRDALEALPLGERLQLLLDSATASRAAGREALRATLTINGGAAVAALAFLGTQAPAQNSATLGVAVSDALAAFATGVFLACWGLGFRYFSEAASAIADPMKGSVQRAKLHERLAVGSGVASILAFLVGAFLVWRAFNTYFTP